MNERKARRKPKDGRRDDSHVAYDSVGKTYNTVLEVDGCRVEFGAMDIDHAQDLSDAINACAWVQAHTETGD